MNNEQSDNFVSLCFVATKKKFAAYEKVTQVSDQCFKRHKDYHDNVTNR